MAFNVGQAPVGVLSRALTGNIFVEKSLAYMNEGDKDGYNCYKHDIKNVLRAYSANPASVVANSSKKENFKRNLTIVESFETFDPADYHTHWKEYQPSGEFQWEELPSEVQSTLEELFLGTSAEAVEDELTNGGSVLSAGLIDQLESNALTVLNGAEATPTQVVNNTAIAFRASAGESGDNLGVALTTSNIFQKLELLIKNQTKAMRKRAGRKFMVSHGTADLIREAQRLELNFKGVDTTEEGVMRYAGYDIIENASFPDDAILFASMSGDMKSDAIQLGTSMSSDYNNLEVNRISNFGREYGMLLTFAIDIFLVRPEEVCFYSVATIA
tara:strand:- start:2150 stop:3136 length:987 start_codon:yes stop_codon:yes gene_type:complete